MLRPELQTRQKTEAAEGGALSLVLEVRCEQGQFRTQFLEGGGGSDGQQDDIHNDSLFNDLLIP